MCSRVFLAFVHCTTFDSNGEKCSLKIRRDLPFLDRVVRPLVPEKSGQIPTRFSQSDSSAILHRRRSRLDSNDGSLDVDGQKAVEIVGLERGDVSAQEQAGAVG